MTVKESLIRDLLRLMIWYPLRWLVGSVPIRAGLWMFRSLGDVHFYLSRSKKRALMENMQLALDQGSRNGGPPQVVREYFRNHYVNQLLIFLFPRLNRANIGKIHVFEGLEYLDDTLRRGNGCILLHPHFGPAQLPLCVLGILGYPMMQLGLLTDEGLSYIGRNVAFRLRTRYENRIPAKIVSANAFLRPVIRWLHDNGALMMTGDGAGGGRFLGKFREIPFFGRPFLFPVGAASLSLKTGSPVLPMFTVPAEAGRYKTIIHKPIGGILPGEKKSPEDITREFAKMMEDYVGKFPHLWHFWDEFEDRLAAQIPSK